MGRGTSRAVPVVVSAGLAVGVFCGLLFGLGTGDDAVTAAPSTGSDVKRQPFQVSAASTPSASKAVAAPTTPAAGSGSAPTTPAAGSGSALMPAAGAGSAPAAGSGSAAMPAVAAGAGAGTPAVAAGSGAAPPTVAAAAGAGSAQPAAKMVRLAIEIMPPAAAATAKITVDNQVVVGGTTEIDLGTAAKKTVKVVVKAAGFQAVDMSVSVEDDVTVKIELIKRAVTPKPRPKSGGGGLSDI